jgi:PKHD-type hydroxylase
VVGWLLALGMFLQVDGLLTAEEVQTIALLARQVNFVDGRRTNPHNSSKVTLIAEAADPAGQKAAQIAQIALQRSEAVRDFVLPRRMAMPSLASYRTGMRYGPHSDAAYLPIGSQPLRSDVSCTIFISAPETYVGGELVIHLGSEVVRIAGKPGAAILYPSNTVHEVAPVTSGDRLVLLTFMESQVPDTAQRNLLYALKEIRALEGLKMDWNSQIQLECVISSLLRMWSR